MSGYSTMSDRELLLVVVERQENHIEQHKLLANKVDRIETKLLEDIENRIRHLENDRYERRGMYKLWLFFIGLLSCLSIGISLLK
jgi:hypothetical protein